MSELVLLNEIKHPVRPSFGFIILRHVNNHNTNKYWYFSYTCIRKYYPNAPIVIIDDNSNIEYLKEMDLVNTTIIKSEYPKRGELLPYIYFLSGHFFETAIIFHDSVFLNKHIDFSLKTNEPYKFIWQFDSGKWDCRVNELTLLSKLDNNTELIKLYNNTRLWKGCFGGMTIIKHSFLEQIHKKHNIYNLIPSITCRTQRCAFERVIACLLQLNGPFNCLLGDIFNYTVWGGSWENKNNVQHLPLIKVWTGR